MWEVYGPTLQSTISSAICMAGQVNGQCAEQRHRHTGTQSDRDKYRYREKRNKEWIVESWTNEWINTEQRTQLNRKEQQNNRTGFRRWIRRNKKKRGSDPVQNSNQTCSLTGQCCEPKPLFVLVYTAPGPTLYAGDLLRRIRVCREYYYCVRRIESGKSFWNIL